MEPMGLFHTTIEIENLAARGPRRVLPDTLVDTGSEYTWAPRRPTWWCSPSPATWCSWARIPWKA